MRTSTILSMFGLLAGLATTFAIELAAPAAPASAAPAPASAASTRPVTRTANIGAKSPVNRPGCFAYPPRPNFGGTMAYRCRIVDFGADMGDGTYRGGGNWQKIIVERADSDGDGSAVGDHVACVPLSLAEPINPRFPLYDEEATSAILYGGIAAFFHNCPKQRISEGMLNANHELRDDYNLMSGARQAGQGVRTYGLWFWQKRDFLNGGDGASVSFDETSMIVPHISRYWQGMDEGRWVVRDEQTFYISEQVFNGDRTSHILYPTRTRWAKYDPRGEYEIDFVPAGAAFAEHTFTDVTAVGFYVARNRCQRGGTGVKWHSFECYAVVTRGETPSFHLEMAGTNLGPAGAQDRVDLYVSKTEVPYSTWKQVHKWAVSNQYCFDLWPGYVFDRDGDMGSMKHGGKHTADEPATDMTWLDAVLWCNALSELEGRTPCYYADAAKAEVLRIVKERDDPAKYGRRPKVYVKWEADGYRLPTAGEWAGLFGPDKPDADAPWSADAAWLAYNAAGSTHPVGQKKANARGLHDMIGNAWEWVWDAGDVFDPAGQSAHQAVGGDFQTTGQGASNPANSGVAGPVVGLRPVRRNTGGGAPAHVDLKPAVPTLSVAPIMPTSQPATTQPAGVEMVKIVDGGFTRREDEAKVTLSPYYIGKTEVPYALWNKVYLWATRRGYEFDTDGDMGSMDWQTGKHAHSPDEPVTDITWNDAALWCNALSEMEGRKPCYYSDPGRTQVLRKSHPWRVSAWRGVGYAREAGWREIHVAWHADGYRLPTEAEWYYAWRGTSDARPAAPAGWFGPDAGGRTHAVGTRQPGALGLCDMEGNVREYAWDWPGYNYYRAHNPKGSGQWEMFGKSIMGTCFGDAQPSRDGGRTQELPGVPRPINGLRIVRCDVGSHPETETFIPKVVFDINARDFDELQGKVFRGNLRRTGVLNAKGPAVLTGVKWKFQTGGRVRSSPVVVGGVAYIGSDDGNVYALDAASGQKKWAFAARAAVVSSAAVVDGVVYIGAENRSLFAIDAASGEQKWRFSRPQGGVSSSPAVAYGVVFAGFGTYNGGGLSGIDIKTGKEVWRYRLVGMNGGPFGPSIDGTTIFAPCGDIRMFAADLRTELPNWTIPLPPCHASIAIHENIVFHHGSGRLTAIRKDTGVPLWKHLEEDPLETDPDPVAGPAVHDGVVYSCWRSGMVYAHKAADGAKLWQFKSGAQIMCSPTLAGGLLYFGSDDGHLYCLDAATGKEQWRYKTGALMHSSPWVDGGVVFFGCDDGFVYAVQ